MKKFTFYFWLQRFDDWHDLEHEVQAENIDDALLQFRDKYPICKITKVDFIDL